MRERSGFHRVIAAFGTVVLLATGMVALDVTASAAALHLAGDPDPTFGGGDGLVTQPAFGTFGAMEVLAIDGQGRTLVAGTSGAGNAMNAELNRFTAGGAPDPTFNGSPTGIDSDLSGQGFPDYPRGLAILTTGEIVRAAEYQNGGVGGTPNTRLAVERLSADGVPEARVVLGDGGLGITGATSGHVAALPGGRFLVSGSNPFNSRDFGRFFVVRFNRDLSVDTTFDGDGIAFVDFGVRAVNQAIAVQPDGGILLAGHIGDGPHDAGIARLTPTGTLDPTFNGVGRRVWDASGSGANDWADGIAVRSDGLIAVSGYSEGGRTGHVTLLQPDGSFDVGFGTGGVQPFSGPRVADVAWDSQGRILVPLAPYTTATTGVARLLVDPSPLDTTFGGDGIATIDGCNGAYAVGVHLDRPVITGVCGTAMFVARFLGADSGWHLLEYTISADAPSGRQQIPLDDATLAALAAVPEDLQASPLRGTPLRGTPLRGTPLRGTPLRGTPLRGTPLRGTPLRGTALDTPLSSIPLNQDSPADPTWSDVLAPTPYRDVPLTNVTLRQVLALPTVPVDPLAGVTLSDIPLRGTPLRGTSISSLLLAPIPLSQLPAPAGGWCAYLAARPGPTCPGIDPNVATLLDLELGGADLAPYFATPIQLAGIDLAGSVLGETIAADLDLGKTPFGALAPGAVPGLVTCTDCGSTLAAVQQAGLDNLNEATRLAALVAALPDVTLGQILPGLVRSEDLPIEDLPLPPLLDRAPVETDPTRQFLGTVSYELQCADGAPEPDLHVTLPPGTRFVAGSQLIDDLGSDALFEADQIPVAVAGQEVDFDLPSLCGLGPVVGIALTFGIDPPVVLGPLGPSTATLATPADTETVAAQAMVEAPPASTHDARENADDLESGAKTLAAGVAYTGHLGATGDIDLYEIPAPPAGSTLAVSLSHLPADYDLTIYGAGDELPSTPLRGTPLRGTPLRGTPVGDSLDEPGASVTEAGAEGLADIPLRGTPLRGTSINRGDANESVSVLSKAADVDHGTFLVQVSGFDGAHSDQPYVLRARVIPGPAPAPCPARSLPSAPAGAWPTTIPAGVQTLFLVNQQRLGALYGPTEAAEAVRRLGDLAVRPDVQGVVLPVESAPGRAVAARYAAWDAEPCSVAAANAVVNEINLVVDDLRPSLSTVRHIVLVGSDEALPQARIPDLTRLSNQTDYTENVRYDGRDNAVSRAFLEGNILSDEPYGDFDPQPWLTGKLYVSDVGLGRLVETPGDIIAAVDRFQMSNGVLNPASSYVTGYDFLSDGARAVATSVARLSTDATRAVTQINETWTADDAADGIANNVGGIASVNAHYDHYEALPAAPFNAQSTASDQLLTTADLPLALTDTILFTMGCEAGLNIADVLVANPAATPSVKDWAQTTTTRGGLFAGNTGYGYGDTDAVAYSERVMANFAQLLAERQSSVGQAMMFAKQRYQAELGVAGVYDAKAMEEATFYGLPMYRIGAAGTIAPAAVPEFEPASVTAGYTSTALDESIAFTPVAEDHGTHYDVTGEEPQVTHARPIQPRFDREFPPTSSGRVHGVVIEDLVSRDIPNVDPAYGTPTIDLAAHEPEAATRSSVFPAAIQSVSSKATPTGRKDVVVLMPGQFFAGDAPGGRGTQRLFDEIHGQVLRSTSTDFEGPAILSVDATELGDVARIDVRSDATDVQRAVGLYRLGTETTVDPDWLRVELGPVAGGRSAVVPLPAGKKVVDLVVQLVDTAGNVGISSNKGPGYRSALVPIGDRPAVTVAPAIDGYYVSQAPTFTSDEVGAALDIAIDDAPPVALTGAVTVSADGPHRVAITDRVTGDGNVYSFFLDTTAPTITISAPVEGATYPYGSVPAAAFACTDPQPASGVAIGSCTATGYGTATGLHTMTVSAVDRAGNPSTRRVSYSVSAPAYAFEGFFAPVDDAPTINKVKAGSNVPVKFRLRDPDNAVVSDTAKVTSIVSERVACSATAATDLIEETTSLSVSSLRYDATSQQFIYNWKTDKLWAGSCRRLVITAVDGTAKTAVFSLVK